MDKKKIGLLFSLSGTVSMVGAGQLQAALLAMEELNETTDMTFEPIVRDDRSDPEIAAREAYSLLSESNIDVLLGCYMSSVRNSVMSVLNETRGLLLYPTLYEGEQVHPNVFYFGAVPNQQVEPLLCWTFHNVSNKFVLVGSDYVYPRSTNMQVKKWVEDGRGTVLSEDYFPLGCTTFHKFFKNLKRLTRVHPSAVVFSTLVGDSVPAFYTEFKARNFSFPIVSPLTSEREISLMSKTVSSGHICASPYFKTLDTESNRRFVQGFTERFGNLPISREMMATYGALHQLSLAYKRVGSIPYGTTEAEKIRTILRDLRFLGPQGTINMDPVTQHLWQWCHIGRINLQGDIDVIWSSPGPIPPRHLNPSFPMAITGPCGESDEHESTVPTGVNHRFLECVRMAETAGRTSSNVLITGETGTGKELLARYIHNKSTRASKPFLAINCASIPRDLVESELFGYEEGAFTGAREKGKPGKFELANGGTLFLDEIGDMPRDLQATLLRVIEDKQIYRIGGTRAILLDVRFIAASNKDLNREISDEGCFRRDLFYRLSVFHIHLPRLSDRPEDIDTLAQHFLKNWNLRMGTGKTFHWATIRRLEEYDWPGNVRELANVVERSFHFSQDSEQIRLDHLPEHVKFQETTEATLRSSKGERGGAPRDVNRHSPDFRQGSWRPEQYGNIKVSDVSLRTFGELKEIEEEMIREALRDNRFNCSMAARRLGIGRSTLYRKMKKYGVSLKE